MTLFGGTLSSTALAANTYSPTATTIANLDSAGSAFAQWVRFSNIVVVSGSVTVDPTTLATLTRLRLSLPVASTLSSAPDCAGTCAAPGSFVEAGAIYANTTNNEAEFSFNAGATTAHAIYFVFLYIVS